MRKHLIVMSVIVLALTQAGGAALNVDGPIGKEIKAFTETRKKADTTLLSSFDKLIARLRKNRTFTAEMRQREINMLNTEKSTFQKSRELPLSSLMLTSTLSYLTYIQDRSWKVRSLFKSKLEQSVGDKNAFEKISAQREKWESELPSLADLTGNTEWHGTRTNSNGDAVDFHVHISEMNDNSFQGQLWQEAHTPWRTGWEFVGRSEGNAVVISTTRMIHGKKSTVELKGFVIGRHMVFNATLAENNTVDLVKVEKK